LGQEVLVLKAYFHDELPRLQAEFSFLELARDCGIECVPTPMAKDDDRAMALYEFLPGRRLGPEEVNEAAIERAASLFATMNRQRHRASDREIPAAAEACFSISEHLGRVERRIERLVGLEPDDDVDERAVRFVADRLSPTWHEIKQRVVEGTGARGIDPDLSIPEDERCLSPSDFGFHNALVDTTGSIRFLDFEYAGWDDPAKLVCDFFCQVAVPAPVEYKAAFEEVTLAPFRDPGRIQQRIALLGPVYRTKWTCIVLNDFLAPGRARRSYALGADQDRERRASQLDKAAAILAGTS
jgi:hypothetical protein